MTRLGPAMCYCMLLASTLVLPALGDEAPDSLSLGRDYNCESDDRYDVRCFPEGSWQREHSDPVVQLLNVGSSGGEAATGFLCSPSGHIMTNHHAVPNQSIASGAQVLFRWEMSECGGGILQFEETIVGLDYVQSS